MPPSFLALLTPPPPYTPPPLPPFRNPPTLTPPLETPPPPKYALDAIEKEKDFLYCTAREASELLRKNARMQVEYKKWGAGGGGGGGGRLAIEWMCAIEGQPPPLQFSHSQFCPNPFLFLLILPTDSHLVYISCISTLVLS